MRTKKSLSDKTLEKLDKIIGGVRTFGELVLSHRTADEITQAELARRIGISQQQLCDIEKNRKPVSIYRAKDIAEALGYPDYIFVERAIQDSLDKAKLDYSVTLSHKKKLSRFKQKTAAA